MKKIVNKQTKYMVLLVLLLMITLVCSGCGTAIDENETPLGDDTQISEPADGDADTNQEGTDEVGDANMTDEPTTPEEPAEQEEPTEPEEPEEPVEPEAPEEPEVSEPSSDMPPSDTETIQTLDADDGNLLVVINKKYSISDSYYPSDMVTIDSSYGTYTGMKIKSVAYDAYLKMLTDARAAGHDFYICSAYRSYDLQKDLYLNSYYSNGADYTNKMFAYPGKSEHHTGLALDITSASMGWGLKQNYTDYPDGAWITEHCAEYGFIIRYPKGKEDITGYIYEPWHIRYVGVDVAKEIMSTGVTLEEYLGIA